MLVNPMNLGSESVGSETSPAAEMLIVAMPRPSVTIPVTVTPGPTKFNWVIDPIPALPWVNILTNFSKFKLETTKQSVCRVF